MEKTEQSPPVPLTAQLWRSQAVRDGMFAMAGQGTATLIALGIEYVLFRRLSLLERGTLSAALNLRNILLALADLGLSITTVRIASEYMARGYFDEANEIYRRALFTRLILALSVFAICIPLASMLAAFPLAVSGHPAVVWAAAAALAGMTTTAWGVDVSQSSRQFQRYFGHQVAESLFKAVAVALAFVIIAGSLTSELTYHVTAGSLLWFMAAGAWLAGLFSIVLQWRQLRRPKNLSSESTSAVHAQIRGFNRYGGAIALLHTVNGSIDLLMIQWLNGGEQTALFDGARRLALILPLIGGVLTTVLIPRASAIGTLDECAIYLRKALKASVVLAVLSAGALAVGAALIVPMLWGDRYKSSIPALEWLCPAYGLTMMLNPLMWTFFPLKRERTVLVLQVVNLILFVALGTWLIPSHGAMGAAWTTLAVKALMAILYATSLWPVLRHKVKIQSLES